MISVKKTSINQWNGPLLNQNPYILPYDIKNRYLSSVFFLLQKYLQPLKGSENAGLVDAALVDEIFYQVRI